ncbi:MAG TPA: carbohydrate porin [Caldimonas sp.]
MRCRASRSGRRAELPIARPGRDRLDYCTPETNPIGVAITAARNGSPYMRSQQFLLQPVTRSETTIELSYLTLVKPWLTVQSDLQYVVHPNTDPSLANAWVHQLRFELTFQQRPRAALEAPSSPVAPTERRRRAE